MTETSFTAAERPVTRSAGLGSALALTTASQVAATASVLALTTIPTLVAASLGLAPHLIGYQVSLIYASGIAFSMMAGSMVKRWGAGRVGQLALLAAAFGFAGLASGHLAGMALASVLIGVGYALNNPSSSHILSRLAPARRRNLIFSVKQAGVPVGGMLAALILPPLAERIGWQAALAVFAVPGLVLALLYQGVRPSWDTDRDASVPVGRGIWRGQRIVLGDPALRTLALLGLLYAALQLSVSTFTVAMLVGQFGWSPLSAASVAAGLQLSGAVGRIAWGLIADRLGSGFLVLALIGVLTALALLLLPLTGQMPALGIAALWLAGFTGNGWNGVLLARTAEASPGKGTLTGEVLTYTFIGVMIGPAAFSALYEASGSFTATFRLFALLGLIGAAMCLQRHRAERRRA